MFIENPLSPLGPLVPQAREDRPSSNFLDIVAQARSRSDVMKAQQYLRAREKEQLTFLSKKSAQDYVSHADGDDYSFEEGNAHFRDGVIFTGESSDISDFLKLPSETSQQVQDSLFYAGSQSRDVLPSRMQVGPSTPQQWKEGQRELKRGPAGILTRFTCYVLGQHPSSDCKLKLRDAA